MKNKIDKKHKRDRVLIIFTHPGTEGHNSLMLEETITFLEEHKKEYELIDLYKLNYDPVLKKEELYSSENIEICTQNLDFQEKISNTKKLVFIFPVWWNGPPAILKGFFDRVFTGRFAFKYKKVGKLNIPVKLLKGKKATILFSTGGPKIASKTLFRSSAEKNVCKDILGFCGIKTKAYQLDNATKINDNTIVRVKKLVSKGLYWLIA